MSEGLSSYKTSHAFNDLQIQEDFVGIEIVRFAWYSRIQWKDDALVDTPSFA